MAFGSTLLGLGRLSPLLLLCTLAPACSEQAIATLVPYDDSATKTWNRDVLPIVRKSCQGCHIADGIGPFAMTSYAEAVPHALKMAEKVTARLMPPWMPDPTCADFKGDRRLSDANIATITTRLASCHW